MRWNAILQWLRGRDSKPQLLEEDEFVYLQLSLHRFPSSSSKSARVNPHLVPIPHSLFSDHHSASLCLLTSPPPPPLPPFSTVPAPSRFPWKRPSACPPSARITAPSRVAAASVIRMIFFSRIAALCPSFPALSARNSFARRRLLSRSTSPAPAGLNRSAAAWTPPSSTRLPRVPALSSRSGGPP
ncbi:hypothetical protein Cni_G12346 [Canna indica]|uniref:Uncharacterized protein n=1 Tax=Canna indica TaxID=4628 RepID=A0AAQ3KDC6_9LILI|nr:hypothetical protein Cni_G12346 [Canna indica]